MNFKQRIAFRPRINKIKETCRLCGAQSDSIVQDVFDNDKDILEKISICLPITIEQHDSLSHKICDPCNFKLDLLFTFINESIATDNELKKKQNVFERKPNDGPNEYTSKDSKDMNLFDTHMKEAHETHKIDYMLQLPTNSRLNQNEIDGNYKLREISHHSQKELSSNLTEQKYDKLIQNKINKVTSLTGSKINENILVAKEIKNNKKLIKKSYICNFCNENFTNFKELKIHSIQIHKVSVSADWVCKFCNKSMTTKVGLLIHERIHEGKKPYICEWCGNGFRSRPNLIQHQVIHTGVRKYSCPRCNKKFSRRAFVETHMRVHTGERPYCCDICGYRFTQIGDMKRHRVKHQSYPRFT